MVLTKLLLEGRKTSVLHLFCLLRKAGKVQETCITSDLLPGVGGKKEILDWKRKETVYILIRR